MPRLFHLERGFPKLAPAGYEKTSDGTEHFTSPGAYNCIAWAAEDTQHGFWWPAMDAYWPPWIRKDDTISCFVKTFRTLGYVLCRDSRKQIFFHKVALYAIHPSYQQVPVPSSFAELANWEPKHMARQLSDGSWTSKCGKDEDITHFTLDALESYGPPQQYVNEYGCPVVYMRRFFAVTWLIRFIQLAWRWCEIVARRW
jgi:hypothetical protein